jgi:hypothetical protein
LADFRILQRRLDVVCTPVRAAPTATIQHLFLNQVVPLALSNVGKLILHGSAVNVDGSAIVFVASSGRGKSTLAAGFAVAGFPFLTDDGLVMEEQGNGFKVEPSHASIRLWQDSQDALIPPLVAAVPSVHYTAKARFLESDELPYCRHSLSLDQVYFLGDGSAAEVSIAPLTARQAFVECTRHSFLLDVNDKRRIALHFEQVTRLATRPIHYRLDYPRQFDQFPQLKQAIVAHTRAHRRAIK